MTETVSKIGEAFDCKVISLQNSQLWIAIALTLWMACYIDEQVVGSKKYDDYIMQPVEGMLSHQLEQNRIDGEKTIIQVGS